jgi:hypothetical protein
MRTFILILCIVAVIVGGTVIYLVVTTPHAASPLRFPLTPSQLELLGRVPATADAYGYIPAPAVLHRTLLENPVTREPLLRWSEEYPLPPAFLLGRADAAIWRSGKVTSYAVRLDPFRAMIVRVWLLFSHANAHFEDDTLLLNADDAAAGAPEARESMGLPEGDVFVVQRSHARGAFPPIGRPALTSVRATPREILITSRAKSQTTIAHAPFVAKFPRDAMLSVAFDDPPRILGDFQRLLGADIEAIAGEGGLIALYKVETGTLLPRPKGVVVVPANGDSRAVVARYRKAIELVGETVERDGEVVVSFDHTSVGQYEQDVTVSAVWPATEWAVRIDPVKLVPVLRKASDNAGLRLLTPRIHRGTRDLRRWIDALERAASIEAALSDAGGVEELRARVTAK